MLNKKDILLFLDVESMGLYGDGFSYGYVLTNMYGEVIEEDYQFSECNFYAANLHCKNNKDILWVENNVLPVAGKFTTTYYLSNYFLNRYTKIVDTFENKVYIVADTPFPVETNFLRSVMLWIDENKIFDYSPYPLIDIASILLSHNLPLSFDRRKDELPIHHPLMDARQTKRRFFELLAENKILVNGINV